MHAAARNATRIACAALPVVSGRVISVPGPQVQNSAPTPDLARQGQIGASSATNGEGHDDRSQRRGQGQDRNCRRAQPADGRRSQSRRRERRQAGMTVNFDCAAMPSRSRLAHGHRSGRSGDPAIRRSGDPAIRRSGDPAIRRSMLALLSDPVNPGDAPGTGQGAERKLPGSMPDTVDPPSTPDCSFRSGNGKCMAVPGEIP